MSKRRRVDVALERDDEKQALVDAIRSAFHGVPRGRITIHEAEVIDTYGTSDQQARARLVDRDASWEEIPGRHINECRDALPHLDPQSWCYYLPRYMECALDGVYEVADRTIYALCFTGDRSLNDLSRARFRELSQAQSEAVSRFLAYMAVRGAGHCDAKAASEALSLFWKKYLTRTSDP